jgi:putative MFS transporter
MRTGRSDEAKSIIDQILVTNGKHMLPASQQLAQPAPVPEVKIFSGPLRRRSILILAVWFLVSISYYGVFVWMPPKLAGRGLCFVRGYGFLVLIALAQLPGYALAAYGVEKWGRRPTLFGFCLLSAAGCFLFVVASEAS